MTDPVTGTRFRIHKDWPKCKFESAEAQAAYASRTSDPAVLAKLKGVERKPDQCNCYWCAIASGMEHLSPHDRGAWAVQEFVNTVWQRAAIAHLEATGLR